MTKKKAKGKKKAAKKVVRTGKTCESVIVKRRGHAEKYDPRKVYASAYFGCRIAHHTEKESEKIAEKVVRSVNVWADNERIIVSDKIFKRVTDELRKHSQDAAFMYSTHRDIS